MRVGVKTIDFYLSEKRDKKAATHFLKKAIANNGMPEKINIDKSGANIAALDQLNEDNKSDGKKDMIEKRTVKYLNNIVEQDHRRIKRRIVNSTGFKEFESAQRTLAGIEVVNVILKNQIMNSKGSSFKTFLSLAA